MTAQDSPLPSSRPTMIYGFRVPAGVKNPRRFFLAYTVLVCSALLAFVVGAVLAFRFGFLLAGAAACLVGAALFVYSWVIGGD
jgi:hypothetical protein